MITAASVRNRIKTVIKNHGNCLVHRLVRSITVRRATGLGM